MSHGYAVTVGGTEHAVTFDLEGRCTVDGRPEEVVIAPLPGGRYAILLGGTPHTFTVRRTGSTYLFVHEGREVPVIVESDHEREMRRVMPVQATGPQKNEIVAPMPALVVRIHVAEGDEVAEGQPLLALEAMKMENEISAPRAGRIREVRVRQGIAVEKGGVLIVLE